MKTARRNQLRSGALPLLEPGFALMELPIVLLALSVLGLVVAAIFRICTHSLPWYAWVGAALALPLLGIASGVVLILLERRVPVRTSPAARPPDSPNDSEPHA